MAANYNTCDDLPGVNLCSIYDDLKAGKMLSSLGAVRNNHTVELTKYTKCASS